MPRKAPEETVSCHGALAHDVAMKHSFVLGVDFGGTTIKVGLVDASGRVVRRRTVTSLEAGTPRRFVETVSAVADALVRSVGAARSALRGVGIGAPGVVDARRGIVRALVNIHGWHDVPLARRFEQHLRRPCLIENDANLFALGEWRFGAGRGSRQLVGLTLGTGVGGGLVFDGCVYRGTSGAAGELGHMAITRSGRRCGCGRQGCLEAHIGTAAVLSYGRRALRQGAEPLGRLVREAQGRLSPALISQAARQGDRYARHIWHIVGEALGAGLANVINLLNPDRIVIGGGVSKAWSLFHPSLIATVRSQAMKIPARAVSIRPAQLGDRAGIVGAAVLVWSEIGYANFAVSGLQMPRRILPPAKGDA